MSVQVVEVGPVSLHSTDTLTHNVFVPDTTSITSDHLLLYVASFNAQTGTPTTSGLTGFTQLVDSLNSGSSMLSVWYKRATGSETDTTITTSQAEKSVSYMLKITGHHPTYNPEISTASQTASATSSPNHTTVQWTDGREALWLTMFSWINGNSIIANSPTGYSDFAGGGDTSVLAATEGSAASGTGLAIAQRLLAATSEDPGAFNWGVATIRAGRAGTLAIAPADAPTIESLSPDAELGRVNLSGLTSIVQGDPSVSTSYLTGPQSN